MEADKKENALDRWIERKRKEMLELQDQISKIEALREKFPDLTCSFTRHAGNIILMSKSVNSQAEKVSIYHSCSCCPDPAVEAGPYIEVDGQIIHSNPHEFCVGEKMCCSGDYPFPGWKKDLKEANISEKVINEIEEHFKKRDPDYEYDEDDEDYCEDEW